MSIVRTRGVQRKEAKSDPFIMIASVMLKPSYAFEAEVKKTGLNWLQ